jgi:hypothetical protein
MWDEQAQTAAMEPLDSTGSLSSSPRAETARSWSCAACGTELTRLTDVSAGTTFMWLQRSLLRPPCGPCWYMFCAS